MWRRFSLLIAGLSTTACAAAMQSSGESRFASAGRDVITAAEIVASSVGDVYSAVLRLRPEFFRKKTALPASPYAPRVVTVYLDGLHWGGPESLRHIPLERVRLIRYMSPVEAELRWGLQFPAGVIHVTTRE